MTLQDIIQYLSNTGLAVFIVAWGIWRLDKFLIKICHHIQVINDEMGELARSVNNIAKHINLESNKIGKHIKEELGEAK